MFLFSELAVDFDDSPNEGEAHLHPSDWDVTHA
ncbi:MAG: hypothetical protein ACJAT5_001129 [Lentimonas sp.]|jgi:hypothetical protein